MAFVANTKKLTALKAKLGELSKARVKVGVLQGADESVETEHGELTIAELAAVHEFGAPSVGIPERSFIRGTFNSPEGQEEITKFTTELADQIIKNEVAPRQALQMLGAKGAAMVRAKIRSHVPPPLKQATIDRKGSSTPLVDTGHLINAVSWETVESEDGLKAYKK